MSTLSTSNSTSRILIASLAGTTIEFFDFYIYATAAVLVFPQLFFPQGNTTVSTLQSLATFALAFFARPIGSALFGHFGDRVGRKATLVAALLTMGLSTVLIGLLPGYQSIGIAATILLCVFRLGQGIGLGGEWGGAVLLAIENAPAHKKSWYGMFPQLGAPLGFLCSTSVFLLLSQWMSDAQFYAWGWRIPFIASAVLVLVGLYVRLNIEETPAFKQALDHNERVRVPLSKVFSEFPLTVLMGSFVALATFVAFYLMTVFTLSWGTQKLGYTREDFLIMQLIAVLALAAAIPFSAVVADRIGRRNVMILAGLSVVLFGLLFAPLFQSGSKTSIVIFMSLGLATMGLTYGPLGTALSEVFPTAVRYTGASVSFNIAGIIGGSFAPAIASWLAGKYGLAYVGYYLSLAGMLTAVASWFLPKSSKWSQ
ncbi:MAG TPA: MFS transporter [Steroidobacteraceae bacterium]|nr:MFS transporter [Steroidobacteraceae bacterium]